MIIKYCSYGEEKEINDDECAVLAAIKRLQIKGEKFVNRASVAEEIAEYFDVNYVQVLCNNLEDRGIVEQVISMKGDKEA